MTETDVRAVLLLRAFERTPASGWTVDDAERVGAQAHRLLGERAAPTAWLCQRARLGLARLAERDSHLAPWLTGAARSAGSGAAHWRAGGLLLLLATGLGLGAESLGAARVINLLAPPLLALLTWNLVVYAALLGAALWPGHAARPPRHGRLTRLPKPPHTPAAAGLTSPLRRWLLRQFAATQARWDQQHRPKSAPGGPPSDAARQALACFGRDWLALSLPLQTSRLAAWLHAAAAALALGAVASQYARGLVFDYRAGWDSTFLDAAAVHQVLAGVLGPAAALSGLALPDVPTLAGLRLASGGGEGAARWIHLWTLTLMLAVVLPRALLAAWAGGRARRLAADLPLPAGLDDLQRLLRSASGQALPVTVLPYSYALDAQRQAALAVVLDAQLGPGVLPQVRPSLPLGAEDDLARWLSGLPDPPPGPPGSQDGLVVALFALTATPERETHGAFVQALAAHLPGPGALRVMVDESGFRARLGGVGTAGAGADRLAQRRTVWRELLQPLGLLPMFIDLSRAPGTDAGRQADLPAGHRDDSRTALPRR